MTRTRTQSKLANARTQREPIRPSSELVAMAEEKGVKYLVAIPYEDDGDEGLTWAGFATEVDAVDQMKVSLAQGLVAHLFFLPGFGMYGESFLPA